MSSTLVHSHLHHHFPCSTPPNYSFPYLPLTSSPPLHLHLPNVGGKKGNYIRNTRVSTMASLHKEQQQQHVGPHPHEIDGNKMRVLLVLGFSVFPFLPLKNHSFLAFATENKERIGQESQKEEQNRQKSPPSNPIISLLNAIGILGAGVLAALYSLARKDKATSEAMIESLNFQLKEKDAAIVSLEKSFQTKLSNLQEEQNKLLSKAKEEQLSLVTRVESANSTITGLGRELQSEKKNIEQLQGDIENLENELGKSMREKGALEERVREKDNAVSVLQERVNLLNSELKEKEEDLQSLSLALAQKDSDLTQINSVYQKALDELDGRNTEILSLKGELLKYQTELEEKNSMLDSLNARMSSLTVERDNLALKLETLQNEFDDLRSSSEKKDVANMKLLKEREHELLELKEKHEFLVDKVSGKEAEISELSEDRVSLQKRLDLEVERVTLLNEELQLKKQDLEVSHNEASKLQGLLDESKEVSSKLEVELSGVQAHLSATRASLEKKLSEARDQMDTLTVELSSVNEELNRTTNDLQEKSSELVAISESHDGLQKELLEVYKKTENVTNDLKEERQLVVALNKQLQGLEKDMVKDKETRKTLEMDLDEVTRSLDELNKTTLMLSKDLEMSHTQISRLEEEREFLTSSLEKEKGFAREARENLEDAHSLVMRLGSERETWEKRARKLEEDLASTKGEILRLRAEVNSSKTDVNNEPKEENGTVVTTQSKRKPKTVKKEPKEPIVNGVIEQEAQPTEATTEAEPVKKTTRRRRAK